MDGFEKKNKIIIRNKKKKKINTWFMFEFHIHERIVRLRQLSISGVFKSKYPKAVFQFGNYIVVIYYSVTLDHTLGYV